MEIARRNQVVKGIIKKINAVISRAKRIERIQEEQTDYSYYNEKTEEYYKSAISKCQMEVKLREVDTDKALIINTAAEKNMFCAKNKKVIKSLINNIEENRIKKFKEIDKHHRTCYQLWFQGEPECNSYMIIDYRGCDK